MIAAEVLLPPACAVDRLKADWDRLYLRRSCEPCVSFEWSRALIRNHLAGRSDWFIVVLRRAATIEGIIPMMTVKERLLGREITTVQPLHELNSTHSDLLVGADSAQLLGAWLDALSRQNDAWDLLRISRLLEDGKLAEILRSELRRRGMLFRMRLEQPSYHLQLPASYLEYLAQRSGKFRNYIKRAEKKLRGAGELVFSRLHDPQDFGRCFEELLSIERDSWKHANGTAISAVAHQAGFYRDLAEAALAAGMLHLTFLRLNDIAVAYNLGVVANGCYFYLKTSYREQYRAHGAASVGRARLIEQLIAENLSELDFPAEPYEWEKQWTSRLRWHKSLLVYNRTVSGRLLWLVNSARDFLRGRADDRRIIHSDPLALQAPQW